MQLLCLHFKPYLDIIDLVNLSRWFIFFNIFFLIFTGLYYFISNFSIFKNKFFVFSYFYFRYLLLLIVNFSSCFYFLFLIKYYFIFFDNFFINFVGNFKPTIWLNDQILVFNLFETSVYYNDLFICSVSKFSILFIGLFCFLYPLIFSLLTHDFGSYYLRMYIYMHLIFFLSYLLVMVDDVILFYFIYEAILILVFGVMFLTSNSRGGVEAILFFAGWAVLGSILVGIGVILLVVLTNCNTFSTIAYHRLTATEIYYIYILFFFGFGTKLSVWPFWYWLPKAHVEVSTGMSIFLSCILIKLSYFCLFRFQYVLSAEISLSICFLVACFSVWDITLRLINLRDLKAVIAYSSVLHTNLLIALAHLDNLKILNSVRQILYVWGHSFATALLFLTVNLIESRYGSRNIIFVSGIWYTSPTIAYILVWSLLSFIEFPLTLFFWGEIWLWIVFLNSFFLLGVQVIFFCSVVFMSIFFKLWWGVLFGTPDINSVKVNIPIYRELYIYIIWLVILQIILGVQPSILTSLVGYIF